MKKLLFICAIITMVSSCCENTEDNTPFDSRKLTGTWVSINYNDATLLTFDQYDAFWVELYNDITGDFSFKIIKASPKCSFFLRSITLINFLR